MNEVDVRKELAERIDRAQLRAAYLQGADILTPSSWIELRID